MNPPESDITNPMHRFDDQARLVFRFAREEAVRLGHSRIAAEHLLLGVLRQETPITQALNQLGLSLKHARNRLEEIVGRRENTNPNAIPDITETARLSMEAAATEARRLQAEQIGIGHVLLGIIRQAEISARQLNGSTALTQILGEFDGGLRGVMRRVLESLRNPEPINAEVPIIENIQAKEITFKLEPELLKKLEQHANLAGLSLENSILEILRARMG
jgi:ATP-dependent Clp protease ATP-binding subunit ClpA